MASTFAALLGYSRIPYASARAGHFFRVFAATHPTGEFPHRSLLLVGGMAMLACLADLDTVIEALLTARIPIQFVGQIATVFYWRSGPEQPGAAVPDAAVSTAGDRRAAGMALCLRGVRAAGRGLWHRLGCRWVVAAFVVWDYPTAVRRWPMRSDGGGSLASRDPDE